MDQGSKARAGSGHYDANYRNFQADVYAEVRKEAYGEDIGQNSWHTAAEQDKFIPWLGLGPGKRVLDVACGAGGPALRMAAHTGCSVVGIDRHEDAISTARSLASERGLSERAEFQRADAAEPLSFPGETFDAISCVDSINHLADRRRVMAEWARVLKPGGRMFFTDALNVTGPLTNAEISKRSPAGLYVFVPPGYNEEVIAECGLELLFAEDITRNMAEIAERRMTARAARSAVLLEIEGAQAYEQQQEFLETAARIAKERRLSRCVYVAGKPA